MSLKRKEVEEPAEFDTTRFKSEEAEKFYEVLLASTFVKERAIDTSPGGLIDQEWFGGVFKKRKWQGLMSPNKLGCQDIVREFYANTLEAESDTRAEVSYKAYVRGTIIDYGPKVIRKLLSLPSKEQDAKKFGANGDDYLTLLQTFPEEMMFEAIVGRSDGRWERYGDSDDIKYMARIDVTPIVKVWAFYIADMILPTLSKSELRKDIITMTFCILNDRPIDLARVISSKIRDIGNWSREGRSMGFPNLITKLVHNKLGTNAPKIRAGIKLTAIFTLKKVQVMIREQEVSLSLPREEAKKGKGKKRLPSGSSSASPTHDEEAPPAWAVEYQRSIEHRMMEMERNQERRDMRIGGALIRRMGDLQHDVEALWTTGQYQGEFRGMAPYTELEQQKMAMSLGTDQGEHVAYGADDDDAMT